MTRAQALELARALTRAAESPEVAGPRPSGMPNPRLLIRRPGDCRAGPGDVVDAVGSAGVDKRRRWVFFAGHVAAVVRQQVITNPALVTRGSVAQEGPGASVARGVTQVLGKLIMHVLASLDAGIAGATAQGHSASGKVMPAAASLSRVTDPASNDRGRPHPGILWRWRHRLRTRGYHRDYRGDGRNHRPASRPCASPRHNRFPLCDVFRYPRSHG